MVTKFRWDGRLAKFVEISVDMVLVFLGFFTVISLKDNFSLSGITVNLHELRDMAISNVTYFVLAIAFFRIYKTSVLVKSNTESWYMNFFSKSNLNWVTISLSKAPASSLEIPKYY